MRGDVHALPTPRQARGQEQHGRRYGVVVQSDLLPLSTWLVAPTSRSARPTRFRPEIQIGDEACLVLVEQTTAVDPERLGPLVGHLSHAERAAVDDALRLALDL